MPHTKKKSDALHNDEFTLSLYQQSKPRLMVVDFEISFTYLLYNVLQNNNTPANNIIHST